jgi:hypothetical protein
MCDSTILRMSKVPERRRKGYLCDILRSGGFTMILMRRELWIKAIVYGVLYGAIIGMMLRLLGVRRWLGLD